MAPAIEAFMAKLERDGVRVVAFDMDLTAVRQHSRGRLRKEDLARYVANASEDFVAVVPELARRGYLLAIATHSDTEEYTQEITPEHHLLGDDLVHPLLRALFPAPLAAAFHVVAYNPRARKDAANRGKEHHIKAIAAHYDVPPRGIVLFDDDERNVALTSSLCATYQVDPEVGFVFGNLQ